MKKEKKQGKDPMRSAKTPQPPQVINPPKNSGHSNDESSDQSPNGKIKRKDSAEADRELAPSEEL